MVSIVRKSGILKKAPGNYHKKVEIYAPDVWQLSYSCRTGRRFFISRQRSQPSGTRFKNGVFRRGADKIS